ncbi:LOC495188 protein [Ectocarpus siliculosus]|uniref:peptidylprolyl isomerase n=1 Tax=Ectocarpus siliculosus TaxID=2880 RepID=D7FW67_ECTSI|nr:LOC495188 protein [Ectocarpus siliculosus]|eukprot:CBJ25587.1 LOC495188 protein [Ectocarpus siliculosus]
MDRVPLARQRDDDGGSLCSQREGVELGLRHMRVGQQCLVRCEARFAYGGLGCPATKAGDTDLPPDTDIEVRLELLSILPSTPVPDMSPEEICAEGERKKLVGNGHFERTAYKKALRAYTAAANAVAELEFPTGDSDTFREARRLRIDCGNNIAMTCYRLGELEKAKEAAVGVLEEDPTNVKALFRAGQVSSLQSNFIEARIALEKARELNPRSKAIQAELGRLAARIKSYKAKRQAMQETMGRSLFEGSKAPPGPKRVCEIEGDEAPAPTLANSIWAEAVSCDAAGQVAGKGAGVAIETDAGEKMRSAVPFDVQRCRGLRVYVLIALAAWGGMHVAARVGLTSIYA